MNPIEMFRNAKDVLDSDAGRLTLFYGGMFVVAFALGAGWHIEEQSEEDFQRKIHGLPSQKEEKFKELFILKETESQENPYTLI